MQSTYLTPALTSQKATFNQILVAHSLQSGSTSDCDQGQLSLEVTAMLESGIALLKGIKQRLHGGAVFAEYLSNITLIDCSFTENHATSTGGVLHSERGGMVTIRECIFMNNSAGRYGGEIVKCLFMAVYFPPMESNAVVEVSSLQNMKCCQETH